MKRDSAEALDRMFGRMVREYGVYDAEKMTKIMAEEIGGLRLIFPDAEDVARMVRNRHICDSFTGGNHEELALRFKKHPRQIRKIVERGQHVFRDLN